MCLDEKTQIQALERIQPILPLREGIPARQTRDYVRNGLPDIRVIPATTWPAETSRGTIRVPSTPVAPATKIRIQTERKTGFEPATSNLASWRSTRLSYFRVGQMIQAGLRAGKRHLSVDVGAVRSS